MYSANHSLYETADTFVKDGGRFLFIDEVHKYPGWSRELKAMYDAFPDLHVYFAGSSVLDIERGESDLSRRAPRYELHGLSFREYLAIAHGIEARAYSLDEIVSHEANVPGLTHPLPLFREYLRRGYYPFGADADYDIELGQVITRTLEVDIPQFASFSPSMGTKLKRLMAIVSTLAPFKPSMTQLASQLGVSRNNMGDYLGYLEKAGMIAQLRTSAHGVGALGKVDKVYLDNTNILYNLSDGREDAGTVRETFFFNQMRVNHLVTSSAISDFQIDGRTFEVGGPSKGQSQIKDADEGYIVRDGIEYGYGNVIPLWAFGLNY
jgi:predicted AAA+ superfamily ATPase